MMKKIRNPIGFKAEEAEEDLQININYSKLRTSKTYV